MSEHIEPEESRANKAALEKCPECAGPLAYKHENVNVVWLWCRKCKMAVVISQENWKGKKK
jgi:hypothetical protein